MYCIHSRGAAPGCFLILFQRMVFSIKIQSNALIQPNDPKTCPAFDACLTADRDDNRMTINDHCSNHLLIINISDPCHSYVL